MCALPATVRLVIFDLDGVIYRGSEPVPGAAELVAWLHKAGARVRFATNNSMVDRSGYVARLGAMGIPTTADEIVTSTSATVDHLRVHAPDVHGVLGIGAEGMRRELESAGLDVVMSADIASPSYLGEALDRTFDAVIVGLDPGLDYWRLAVGMTAVAAGARLIATNADTRYPTAAGFLPGAGSIVAAIRTATGVEPLVVGKPSPAMFSAILDAAGVHAAEAVVVGDNPAADIAGARRAGCASILVLTGVATEASADALEGDERPDLLAAGPPEVRRALEGRVSA